MRDATHNARKYFAYLETIREATAATRTKHGTKPGAGPEPMAKAAFPISEVPAAFQSARGRGMCAMRKRDINFRNSGDRVRLTGRFEYSLFIPANGLH